MKIILLQDVKGIGKKLEVKDVSDGYARNFLIPRKLAEFASPSTVKKAESLRKTIDAEKEVKENLAKKAIELLRDTKVTINKKGNGKGHLFAAVHESEIAEALKTQAHIEIDPEYVETDKPIKEAGDHKVKVKVGNQQGEFVLTIIVE
jgi:large subunit ribosomal protein L9